MIVEKQILVVNEVITAPKNLKIRYNVEEDGFYKVVAICELINRARISLRKNNRLEGVFSLNACLNNISAASSNHTNTFSVYQSADNTNFKKHFANIKVKEELGIIQVKKGLLTGVLLLDFIIGTPDGRFQLILQKVRFEEEDQQ